MRRAIIAAVVIAAQMAGTGALAADETPIPAPLMDDKRVNHATLDKDLSECRDIAEATIHPPKDEAAPAPSTTAKAKNGAVSVAKAGAKTVAKSGLNIIQGGPNFVRELSGANAAARGRTIVSNCMKGRGYPVLE